MKGYRKPKPLTFTELEARVKAYEGADRSDASSTTKASALLHTRYSTELGSAKANSVSARWSTAGGWAKR